MILTPEIKHQISIWLVDNLDAMEKGRRRLPEAIAVIDAIAQEYPGEDQQAQFYDAVRELSGQVWEGVKDRYDG